MKKKKNIPSVDSSFHESEGGFISNPNVNRNEESKNEKVRKQERRRFKAPSVTLYASELSCIDQ